ncbi:hypothetical protein RSAG8_12038, partial [Rhizoctonia solani AG-8 WAC10335]
MGFSLACFAIVALCSTLVSSQPTSIWDVILPGFQDRFLTPVVSQTTCKLRVYQGTKPLGYLSSTRNSYGEYGTLQDSSSGALSVAFSASRSNSKELSLRVVGAAANMSMFGGIIGFTTSNDNLVTGSHHYAYIGLTPQTPSGSIPLKGTNSFDQFKTLNEKSKVRFGPMIRRRSSLPLSGSIPTRRRQRITFCMWPTRRRWFSLQIKQSSRRCLTLPFLK